MVCPKKIYLVTAFGSLLPFVTSQEVFLYPSLSLIRSYTWILVTLLRATGYYYVHEIESTFSWSRMYGDFCFLSWLNNRDRVCTSSVSIINLRSPETTLTNRLTHSRGNPHVLHKCTLNLICSCNTGISAGGKALIKTTHPKKELLFCWPWRLLIGTWNVLPLCAFQACACPHARRE